MSIITDRSQTVLEDAVRNSIPLRTQFFNRSVKMPNNGSTLCWRQMLCQDHGTVAALTFVRFWTKADKSGFWPETARPLMTKADIRSTSYSIAERWVQLREHSRRSTGFNGGM